MGLCAEFGKAKGILRPVCPGVVPPGHISPQRLLKPALPHKGIGTGKTLPPQA